MSSSSRYQQKADALYTAWTSTLGHAPSHHALVLAMAVAELETNLGDWDGSHNWGGVYKRVLTGDEVAILDANGVVPTGTPAERGAALQRARALLPAGPNEILRIDSAPPPRGWYFVWSWAFPSDVEGAKRFVHVLVETRPGVAAIIDTATAEDLARAMYNSKYFEGNSTDPEANIAAYGASIAKHVGPIEAALASWSPLGTTPAPPSPPPAPPLPPAAASSGSGGKVLAVVAIGALLAALASKGRAVLALAGALLAHGGC